MNGLEKVGINYIFQIKIYKKIALQVADNQSNRNCLL